jgi:hypothetical protein
MPLPLLVLIAALAAPEASAALDSPLHQLREIERNLAATPFSCSTAGDDLEGRATAALCASPYAAICADNEENLEKAASPAPGFRLARPAMHEAGVEGTRVPAPGSPAWLPYVKALERGVDADLKQRGLDLAAATKAARTALKTALRDFPSPGASERVDAIRIERAGEYLVDAAHREERARAFAAFCGDSALGMSAFFDPGASAFVLCPGLVINAASRSDSQRALEQALLPIVVHELTHGSADASRFRTEYRPLRECLAKWVPEMSERASDPVMDEVSADTLTAAVWVKRYAARGVPATRITAELKRAYVVNCLATIDPRYPSVRFRLDVTLGEELRRALGCAPITACRRPGAGT